MTKAQIAAKEVFERFPTAKEVFVTPDEQAFLDKNRAAMHNSDYETVNRSEVIKEEPKEDKPAAATKSAPAKTETKGAKTQAATKPAVEVLIASIKVMKTTSELDDVAKGEKRGSVKDAIEARRTELASEMEVNQNKEQ